MISANLWFICSQEANQNVAIYCRVKPNKHPAECIRVGSNEARCPSVLFWSLLISSPPALDHCTPKWSSCRMRRFRCSFSRWRSAGIDVCPEHYLPIWLNLSSSVRMRFSSTSNLISNPLRKERRTAWCLRMASQVFSFIRARSHQLDMARWVLAGTGKSVLIRGVIVSIIFVFITFLQKACAGLGSKGLAGKETWIIHGAIVCMWWGIITWGMLRDWYQILGILSKNKWFSGLSVVQRYLMLLVQFLQSFESDNIIFQLVYTDTTLQRLFSSWSIFF